MSATVTPAVLADRVRVRGLRMSDRLALETLRYWERRGIAEETFPGRWKLTPRGAAMFSAWIETPLDDDGQELERVTKVSPRRESFYGRRKFRVLGGDEERAA